MEYYVYIDHVNHVSRIHQDKASGGCGTYERRKPDTLPDNEWIGPFTVIGDAAARGLVEGIDTVSLCRKCPIRVMRPG